MKIIKLTVGTTIVLFAAISAQCQSNFLNLDFESATLSPVPSGQYGGSVPIASALPGWSGSIGNTPVTQILQNNATLGTASIDILGPDWGTANQGASGVGVISGNYTVVLQSGEYTSDQGFSTSIAQNGTVPDNSQSLQFQAAGQSSALSVSFSGNNLSLTPLSSGLSSSGIPYTLYGVDIAAYAGQSGQLEFTEVFNVHEPSVELDDITFSPTAVPEPSTLALFVTGGIALVVRRWRNIG